ncbi:hypothetical protein [Alphabaculovirus altersperidaniae]|uniref:Uncharacterized protein n=1 Tax=Spodoptera eridania nucleopolyhedrovirus TaxID=2315721 RepID=A0ABX6TRV7_9ABAC|nr:hypothetical protein QKS47_gp035 [Spodoptera eridania nucleopolyhedrovirus]QNV47861.1 hypothetical protein [Spodoptera eridania nucleopolyhedrovirus]
MRIVLYTMALTSVEEHDVDVVNKVLNEYFCPIFVMHGIIDTLALCEDRVYEDSDVFSYYENFLQSAESEAFAATIQEVGDIDQKIAMIQKIVSVITESDGVIVLSDYYN